MKHFVPGTRVSLLSWPSKMDCASWSLPAGGAACPSRSGSICESCYAMKGRYVMANVRNAQEVRMKWTLQSIAAQSQLPWIDTMVAAIRAAKVSYFRIHDSGDMFSPIYCGMWIAVCRALPNVQFWCPTRRYGTPRTQGGDSADFNILQTSPMLEALRMLSALPNVAVTPSALDFGVRAPFVPGLASGVGAIRKGAKIPACGTLCPASANRSSCDTEGCRQCWQRGKRDEVYYLQH